ncbi:ferritin-like domain-containing protein [Sphingomonas sp. ID0503]|uniref:ferritin-like domain-containing protein n=1 Tax=Sphingomonas sp. ID0503 TaxID=3399691 RepID=UPI003AFB6EB6
MFGGAPPPPPAFGERSPSPCREGSVATAAHTVLTTADPRAKALAARKAAREWLAGRLAFTFDLTMPDRPARPEAPELLPPNRMPKRGRLGSTRGQIAMLHAVANIEFNAIDLAFDIIGRFGHQFPRAFTDDWLRVGAEEAAHFALVARRLRALGAAYGDLPAHDGLWEAAEETRHDALARLAIVPMVLEARGLDVTPAIRDRFAALGDTRSATVLDRILSDEIGHVATGVRWFRTACATQGFEPEALWHDLVARHFRGALKPPFNDSARDQAGLSRDFYAVVAR